jgi:hypothetical protein
MAGFRVTNTPTTPLAEPARTGVRAVRDGAEHARRGLHTAIARFTDTELADSYPEIRRIVETLSTHPWTATG